MVRTPFGRIANVICYDADFPALTRPIRADVLLVPGADWPQIGRVHTLMMARLRAIEAGYSLFRDDMNGLSATFDNEGHVLGAQDTTGGGDHVLTVDMPTRGAATPYARLGDLCVAALGGLALLALIHPTSPGAGRPQRPPSQSVSA